MPRQLQEDLQLTIYAFAASHLFGQDVQQVVYYHLRDQSELVTGRTESELRTLTQATLPQVANGVANEHFEACPGYYCPFCDYWNLCQEEGGVNLSRHESH